MVFYIAKIHMIKRKQISLTLVVWEESVFFVTFLICVNMLKVKWIYESEDNTGVKTYTIHSISRSKEIYQRSEWTLL